VEKSKSRKRGGKGRYAGGKTGILRERRAEIRRRSFKQAEYKQA
jgi:hypothetical protein